jgi:DNA-binding CsgD family transcriptional regulator
MSIKAEMINQGRFTQREAQVATLMAEGHADKIIARLLAISIRTVNVHANNIYEKLELYSASIDDNTAAINSRVYAVAVMIAKGMVSVSIKSVALMLISNMAQLDDEFMRSRSGRVRVRVPAARMRDA